jgi:hypothetical protein
MSFFRNGEIYRPIRGGKLGQPWTDCPQPHRYDEFPAGYSLAGCAPTEPASASPLHHIVQKAAVGAQSKSSER